MMKLQGKVALITGGGTGIGRALALALAQEGAHLVVTGRRLEPLQEVAKRIGASGGQVRLMSGDVALAGDARRMVEECLGAFGRLDVLVNNA
ncbi:MAG: SDR family NAD(P)-dependent oxidoreductase, partial [Deinococcus sp.]|nr:SDR family NAD(P)-dependent oxidoreductase [Deinococcus sp.]